MLKKLILLPLLITFCMLVTGCNKNENTFSLEKKYYQNSSYIELNEEKLNTLIKDKESFAVFVYQPLCTTSYEFNQILTEFSNTYQVSFYKIAFSDMKETQLGKYVKYYPSVVIYKDGEVIDYLDANSDEDTNYYKSINDFTSWFKQYVKISKTNTNNSDTSSKDEENNNTKIDAELKNVVYNENKVNIYFFWGNGCPHCEEEFEFLESIKTEYGDYFTLNTFEVWYNKDNVKVLESFANAMGEKVTGIPYTIIGNKTFTGFKDEYKKEFLTAIKEQYKNSYDVYFDKIK